MEEKEIIKRELIKIVTREFSGILTYADDIRMGIFAGLIDDMTTLLFLVKSDKDAGKLDEFNNGKGPLK